MVACVNMPHPEGARIGESPKIFSAQDVFPGLAMGSAPSLVLVTWALVLLASCEVCCDGFLEFRNMKHEGPILRKP